VEAALIDFVGLDNLTDKIKGHFVERGKISCEELDIRLGAEKIEIQDNVMLIKINLQFRSDMNQEEIYEATRKWWTAKKENAKKVKYVLSINNGIVRGVFIPTEWYKAKDSNRIAFKGVSASDSINERYLHKSIEEYVVKGSANPIQYLIMNKSDSKPAEIQEPKVDTNEKELEIIEKSILIKINASYYEGMSKEEIYNATKGNWKLSLDKAQKAEYIFSIVNGMILEIYKITNWYEVKNSDRIAFEGVIASEKIRDKYIDKSVRHLYLRGEANPCKYRNI